MASFHVYLTFMKKAFMRSSAYRMEVWSKLFSNVIYLLMWGSIWTALYAGNDYAGEVSYTSMLTYVVVSQFLTGMNGAGTPIWEIQMKVRSGDIALEIMKPFYVPLRYLFADLGSVFFYLITALLPMYIIVFTFVDVVLPTDVLAWFVFILSSLLGFLIRYCIEMAIAFLSFFLVETGGMQDIFLFFISLFSGAILPLWMFPAGMEQIASWLPFQCIYYLPNSIFIGNITASEYISILGLQLFWLIVCIGILTFTFHRATKKVVVQGG